eukprot:127946-Chlamydomonas_euryale.AAC.1
MRRGAAAAGCGSCGGCSEPQRGVKAVGCGVIHLGKAGSGMVKSSERGRKEMGLLMVPNGTGLVEPVEPVQAAEDEGEWAGRGWTRPSH